MRHYGKPMLESMRRLIELFMARSPTSLAPIATRRT